MRRFRPSFESCEPRIVPTLVFVFNGNGFAAANPNPVTQLAADQLALNGDRAVQLSTPAMSSPAAFRSLADTIHSISKGQPIGLFGYSAGGALALRLSGVPDLNVRAVMNFYGPPDLKDWLSTHHGDTHYRHVTRNVHFDRGIINLLSGPVSTNAYIVNAWGLKDTTVVSSVSTTDFQQDYPPGQIYYYPGGHGGSLFASIPAFNDFVSHLTGPPAP